jgi:hypothetical protein
VGRLLALEVAGCSPAEPPFRAKRLPTVASRASERRVALFEAICTSPRSVVHFPKRGEKPDGPKDKKSSGTSTNEEKEEAEGLDRERLNPLG